MEDRFGVTNSVLSRRKALKVLAGVTSAAALSALPNGWQKPLMTVGAMPAKAQDGSGLYIDQASLVLSADIDDAGSGDNPGFFFAAVRCQFDYLNAVGGVALMDVTFAWEGSGGKDVGSDPTPSPTIHVEVPDPDGTAGHIDHTIGDVMPGGFEAELSIFIKDGSGKTSNTVTGALEIPLA